jgi:hypothetical protein
LVGFGSITSVFLRQHKSVNLENNFVQTDHIPTIDKSNPSPSESFSTKTSKDENNEDQNSEIHEIDLESNSPIIAQNFSKSAYLESFIDNFRSNMVKVVSPTHNKEYIYKDKITFSWEGEKGTELIHQLTVYDNRETIVYRANIENPFTLSNDLKSGLYYWKIETEKGLLYLDKFKILNK